MQGLMGFTLAVPLAYAVTGFENASILSFLFIIIWSSGFLVQAVADRQLAVFSRTDDGTGVLSTGLWRYSRHPNYFGELCMIWAIFALAAANGGVWTLFAPLLMTWSIFRFTGITRMEDGISSRRPGYESYMKKTSALIPLPPRKHV
jgi:steroid 5-alpha reductase family enzyme